MSENPSCSQQESKKRKRLCQKWNKKSQNEFNDESDEESNEAVQILECNKNFDEQLEHFRTKNCLTLNSMTERYAALVEDLKPLFQRMNFREYTLQPFGSYVTKLLLNTSDVDIFLYSDYILTLTNDQQHSYARNAVKRLTKIINLMGAGRFANIKPIANARVPMVKFDHRPTGLSVDINFTEFIGPINCEIIVKMYQYCDKIRDAMLILKYWGLVHGFVAQCKMSSYLLNIMFIFYLQTKKLLPSIYNLQNQRDLSLKYFNKWMISYRFPESFPTQNFGTVENLLRGFFLYYANFDFFSNIICPYLGVAIHKSSFLNINSVPREFYYYKKICQYEPLNVDVFICAQDLLMHNRCITSSKMDDKTYCLFLDKLNEANEIFQSDEKTNILSKLFNVDSSKSQPKTTSFSYGFHIPTKFLRLGKKCNYSLKPFHKEFKNVLMEILRDIFCLKCDISVFHNMDVTPFKLVVNCTTVFNIWASRKQVNTTGFTNAYEYEKSLSLFLIKNENRKLTAPMIFKIQFLLNIKRLNLDIKIEVVKSPSNNINTYDRNVYNFFVFFKSKIESIMYLYSQYKISNVIEIDLVS